MKTKLRQIEIKMIQDFKMEITKMEREKVKYLIDMINDMDLTNKLRLAICMSDSSYTNLKYDKTEMYIKFDNMLKEIDDEYRTTLINFAKYHLIMFAMAKIMEMTKEEQNQVILFLFNTINSEINKIKHIY